ncbi:MAG: ACT domain-containing protein [Ruminococcus sp.]|nr:ACT domain-containing protein [Ruminococcus sp.]
MKSKTQFIVVDSAVLPEVFGKVLEVKKLVAHKAEKSCASACKSVGISRSAYYKYKDSVFIYEDVLTHSIVNIYVLLKDNPGVLSSVLIYLHSLRANILTVNQSIPIDGVASVNITLKLSDNMSEDFYSLNSLKEIEGVVEVKILSAE